MKRNEEPQIAERTTSRAALLRDTPRR